MMERPIEDSDRVAHQKHLVRLGSWLADMVFTRNHFPTYFSHSWNSWSLKTKWEAWEWHLIIMPNSLLTKSCLLLLKLQALLLPGFKILRENYILQGIKTLVGRRAIQYLLTWVRSRLSITYSYKTDIRLPYGQVRQRRSILYWWEN